MDIYNVDDQRPASAIKVIILLNITMVSTTATSTVSNKVGDQSGTSWVVTSSPLFSMLGKENKSPSAIM